MKNNYLKACVIAASTVLLFSCQKEASLPTSKNVNLKKHAIKFEVSSGFTQQTTHISSGTTASFSEQIDRLYYLVFDSKGEEVSRQIAHYEEEGFGSIQDSLPDGTYTVAIIGAKGSSTSRDGAIIINKNRYEFEDGPVKYNLSEAHFDVYYDLSGSYRTDDLFMSKFKMSVGGDNVVKDVVLKRIVGALEINIEDAMPADAAYVTATIDNELSQFNLNDETLSNSVSTELFKDVSESDIGKENFKIQGYIMNTDAYFKVTIKCFDKDYQLISEKIAENVVVGKNKRLILSGKLFGSDVSAGKTVNVGIDNVYDPEDSTFNF